MENGEFTLLLARYRQGEQKAHEQLIDLIHGDLRKLARRHLAGNRWMNTLNTTSVVNESYLRLVSPAARHVETRAHFMNLASRVMRQIICDYARKSVREAERFDRSMELGDRPGDGQDEAAYVQARQFTELDIALTQLARVNERCARVIECRFFGGLSEEETAEALNISVRTVQRDWHEGRAWLEDSISGS